MRKQVYLISYILLFYNINSFKRIYCVKSKNHILLSRIESKIVGGSPVRIQNYPFAVLFFNNGAICSGVILNSLSVLTAAHCFGLNNNTEQMEIAVGSRYIQDLTAELFEVLNIVIHEDYNQIQLFSADIALIFLKEKIMFNEKIQRAILVDNDNWMDYHYDNEMKDSVVKDVVIAVGWGWTKYNGSLSELGLLQTTLQFIPRQKCETLHNVTLAADMFCLYGDASRDTCKGDSGGGVVWNGAVIGITSHGNGCAKKDKPSVYISVYYHREWIEGQIKNFSKNYCNLKLQDHPN